MLGLVLIFGIFISAGECDPVHQRRAAFDPDHLMERYMDMRTNQGVFGSYHPNDLVQSIVDYFNSGSSQALSGNQWGLAVYNPNEKMAQYMGNLESPGNLGPLTKEHTYDQEVAQSNEGASFNPTTLNQRLIQSALNKGSQFSNLGQQSADQESGVEHSNLGFDADALNRKMMESAMKKESDNKEGMKDTKTQSTNTSIEDTTGTNADKKLDSQILGFNPDTLNAGLLNSLHEHGTNNGGASSHDKDNGEAMMLGFNPDKLNSGLIGSLGYNPNSAMEKTSSMKGNGAMVGETVHGASIIGDHPSNPDKSSVSSPFTGMTAIGGAAGLSGYNGQLGSQHTGSNTVGAATNPFQAGVGNGKNTLTGMYNVNQNGAMQVPGEMKGDIANFEAGGIGPQDLGKQNVGVPPGVSSASELKQTEISNVKVNGIGGMG